LPKAWPRALLEGFEWDASGRQYEGLPALRAYAARVAGSVGAMMASVLGARDRDALGRACELGIAMQLTNIARDVGEDARLGRLYLPRNWMREVGIDPDRWLQQPAFTPALAIVIRRLLDEADTRYRAAAGAIEALPFACRPGIRAAAALYRDIGRSIERAGFDSVGTRAVVGRARKAAVLSIAIFGTETGPRAATCAAPGEVDFLLDTAPPHPARRRSARSDENSSAPSGMVGLLQIFERLERRDRMRSAVLAAPARPGLET
jgi:phytoene synthase